MGYELRYPGLEVWEDSTSNRGSQRGGRSVHNLRREASNLKEVLAEQMLEMRLLKANPEHAPRSSADLARKPQVCRLFCAGQSRDRHAETGVSQPGCLVP